MLLQYDISVVGMANVKRALASLERRFAAHNQKVSRMVGGSPGRGGHPYRSSGASKANRAWKSDVAAEEAARIRAEHRIHRIARRNQLRRARANRRDRMREERDRQRASAREARDAAKRRRAFRGAVLGVGKRSLRGARRAVGAVGRYGLMTAGLMGGFAMAGALDAEKRTDTSARELAIQATSAGGKGTKEEYYARYRQVAKTMGAQGFDSEQVLAGMRAYQAPTGAPDEAIKLGPLIAKLAKISGSSVEDVGGAAGEIGLALNSRNITDSAERMKILTDVLGNLAKQGAMGSIEFKDFASTLSKVGAASARFAEMDPAESIKMLAGMAQLAKAGGATSADEATTSLMRFTDDLMTSTALQGKVKGLGIDPFTYKEGEGGKKVRTGLRNPMEVLGQIMEKSQGDIKTLTSIFGKRGIKVAEAITQAVEKAGGGKEGFAKVLATVQKFSKAKMTMTEVNDQVAFMQQSPEMRMQALKENFNANIGPKMVSLFEKLFPVIEKMIPVFEKLVDAVLPAIDELVPAFERLVPYIGEAADMLARFIKWASENPYKGLGAVIAAALGKEIAAAGISSMIKKLVMGGAAGSAGPGLLTASTAGAAGGIGLGIYGAYEGSQGAGEDLKKLGLPDWLSTGLGALHGYGQMLTAGTSLPMAAGKSLITGQTFKSAMFGGKQTEDAVGLKNKGAHSRLDAALKAAQAKQGDDKSVEAAAANKEAAAANKEAAAANKEAAAMARSGGGPNRGNSPTQ